MKKVLSAVLALAKVFSLSCTAFAVEEVPYEPVATEETNIVPKSSLSLSFTSLGSGSRKTSKKGIHRGLGLLLAIVVVAMLAACSTKDSVSEVPDKDDSDAIVPPASVLPFADVVDLSEYFVDEPVEFSESTPKGELVCVNIDESQYSKADDTILLPNEKTKAMAVHCTWASASRTIYIGFIDEVSEEVYTLSAVGGALTGTLDLSSLPEGEYRPIMYSSDNQNINAVMLYQFQ